MIRHAPQRQDAYLLTTRYGREIRVTGDHSVFRQGRDGHPEAVPVRQLAVGEHVAIAGRVPAVEKDVRILDAVEYFLRRRPADLWQVALVGDGLKPIIATHREKIIEILADSGRFADSKSARNTVRVRVPAGGPGGD